MNSSQASFRIDLRTSRRKINRDLLAERDGLSERKMFGGLCFMIGGNMCVGIVGSELMVRVGPDAWNETLRLPRAREMDFTGKSIRGMVYVDERGVAEDHALRSWGARGEAFASSLPAKAR